MKNLCGASVNTNSCGLRASCGARPCSGALGVPCNGGSIGSGIGGSGSSGAAYGAPVIKIDVGLEKKPGVAPADAALASRTLVLVRARTQACVVDALRVDPTISSAAMTVDFRSDGVTAPVVTLTSSFASSAAQTCIKSVLARQLGGDTAPAAISFPIWIDIDNASTGKKK
jgi:hypothetical protein